MTVGELFARREAHLYPAPDDILAAEIAQARKSYPQHADLSDAHLLAFMARSLAKAVAERTAERDALMRPDAATQRRMRLSWPVMADTLRKRCTPEQLARLAQDLTAPRSA